jgi:DNA-binding IclR family transcriptional regulator
VATIDALRRDLAGVRRTGYATAVEEAEAGVAAIAVAIRDPASGRAMGTTSVAGPIVRLPAERRAQLANLLDAAARELARVWPLARTQSLPSKRQARR